MLQTDGNEEDIKRKIWNFSIFETFLTVTLQLNFTPLYFTVIFALPADLAVTFPFLFTDATLELFDL